ncbi:MAG: hypothetical protein IJ571_03600 [Ruminococcus sp.]|nr:hypothetical protein [Ruminococcus sp.]
MKKPTLAQRIFSLMFALSFITLLFSNGDVNVQEDRLRTPVSRQSIIAADVYRLLQGVCSEELLPSRLTRITHTNAVKKQEQQKSFEHFLCGSSFLFIAAAVLYLLLFQVFRQVQFRRKYIIKYIHDQDGYKNRPSLYCITDQ